MIMDLSLALCGSLDASNPKMLESNRKFSNTDLYSKHDSKSHIFKVIKLTLVQLIQFLHQNLVGLVETWEQAISICFQKYQKSDCKSIFQTNLHSYSLSKKGTDVIIIQFVIIHL